MFSSLTGWMLIAIVAGIILIIGGIALPIIVPMMIEFTQGSQDVITSGTPFFQFMADWWPLLLPGIIILSILVLVMSRRGAGGGSV